MSKRAKDAASRALPNYPPETYADNDEYIEVESERSMQRAFFQQGYEQAEKDIEALILKFLDSRYDRDYATVGWIKKNFGEYKKEIMEEN